MYGRFKTLTTSLLALVILLTLALPAAARQGGFTVTPAQLQGRFAEYSAAGFSLNFEKVVESAQVTLSDDGVVILDVVVLGIDKSSPLLAEAVVAPDVVDGAVNWRYVDASFSDSAGNAVDLPPDQARAMFRTMQTAWSLSFVDSVRTAREKSLNFEEIKVTFAGIEVMGSDAVPTRSGGPEGQRSITITQDHMNRALAAAAGRIDGVDSMSVEITEDQLLYTVGMTIADGTSNTLLLTFVRNGMVGEGDFDALVGARGSSALFAADSITLTTGKAAVEALAPQAEQAVIRTTNQFFSFVAGSDIRQITSLIIFIGGFELMLDEQGNDSLVRSSGPQRIEVSEAQLNSAFAAMAAKNGRVDSLTAQIDGVIIQFTMKPGPEMSLNFEEIKWTWRIDPESWSWGHENGGSFAQNLPKPQNLTCCGGQTLEPNQESLLQFEIQDLMSRFFPGVIRHAAGGQPITGIESGNGFLIIIVG